VADKDEASGGITKKLVKKLAKSLKKEVSTVVRAADEVVEGPPV